jgi:hypothetical protein
MGEVLDASLTRSCRIIEVIGGGHSLDRTPKPGSQTWPFGLNKSLAALAAFWTAERIVSGTAVSLPQRPDYDAEELPMRIFA